MANLDFCNKHNMVAFLEKSEGSEGFHQILDFLNSTHINTLEDGKMKITATINGRIMTITEASIRRHLNLEDSDGITTFSNAEIFKQLALMGAWDQIHAFVPMDSEIEKEMIKKSRFDLQQKQFAEEVSEKKDDSSKSAKRQKLKDVTEEEATTKYEKDKEELRLSLKIIHYDDSEVNYKPLSRKFPIVSWEYHLLGKMEAKDIDVCKLAKADGSSSYHGNIQDFLRRLDRQDLNDLYSLVQESADTEILLDQEEPTELVEDLGSGEKGEKEISTIIPKVSTAVENLVYIRRSVEKRKDKGKAIIKEDKSVQKKLKKQLEQERLGHEEAIRLQEQIFKEERQRIARDGEIAKQL
nr:hypothetical protein [Tanacetum cinerariifolium]